MEKQRLDKIILEKWYTTSRDRAISLIKKWQIKVDWKVITKPSLSVSEDNLIELIWEDLKWVSRWWLKLEHAFKKWNISVKDKIAMDIWASTWGFCDVLLEWKIWKIYAIDVWHSQLHEKIISNPKVINLEKTNARELTSEIIPEKVDFICTDVSFISLSKIIPKSIEFLKDSWEIVALIKPQFELTKEALGSSWVVKSEKLREEAVLKIKNLFKDLWLKIIWICDSPIGWWSWNKEFLIYAKKSLISRD